MRTRALKWALVPGSWTGGQFAERGLARVDAPEQAG
jgi:hypothetical protein